jgi:hypothetical protein
MPPQKCTNCLEEYDPIAMACPECGFVEHQADDQPDYGLTDAELSSQAVENE